MPPINNTKINILTILTLPKIFSVNPLKKDPTAIPNSIVPLKRESSKVERDHYSSRLKVRTLVSKTSAPSVYMIRAIREKKRNWKDP